MPSPLPHNFTASGGLPLPAGPNHLQSIYESQQSISKSQENIMSLVKEVSSRVSKLEEAAITQRSSDFSSSPEEKKRLPSQLSVSLCGIVAYNNCF